MGAVHLSSVAIPEELWLKVKAKNIVIRQVVIEALEREVNKKEKRKDDGGTEGDKDGIAA
jgi:hypothetical protein